MAAWGLVAEDPPKQTADDRFEKLLAEASKAPEKANWKVLREPLLKPLGTNRTASE